MVQCIEWLSGLTPVLIKCSIYCYYNLYDEWTMRYCSPWFLVKGYFSAIFFFRINALNAELAQKNMIIEMLRRQLMEKDNIISSMERLPRPISSSSPQNSQQNIVHKSSIESMHNAACSPGSSSSLQNLMQRSPVSSQQNLVMRSPNGSHQSLAVKAPSRGPGSQERLLTLSDSHTSLSTSGLSTAGTGGFFLTIYVVFCDCVVLFEIALGQYTWKC